MEGDFAKSVGVWLFVTGGSALLFFLQDSGWSWLSRTQAWFLLLLCLLTDASAGLLKISVRFLKSAQGSALCGLALGFGLPALAGVLVFAFTSGFESPAILVGALMVSIPNAIGGTITGWMLGKSALAQSSVHSS